MRSRVSVTSRGSWSGDLTVSVTSLPLGPRIRPMASCKVMRCDVSAIDGQDDVAATQAGLPGWLTFERFHDAHAAALGLRYLRADALEAAFQRLVEEGRLLRCAQIGVVVAQLEGEAVDRAVGQLTHVQGLACLRLLARDLQRGRQHGGGHCSRSRVTPVCCSTANSKPSTSPPTVSGVAGRSP